MVLRRPGARRTIGVSPEGFSGLVCVASARLTSAVSEGRVSVDCRNMSRRRASNVDGRGRCRRARSKEARGITRQMASRVAGCGDKNREREPLKSCYGNASDGATLGRAIQGSSPRREVVPSEIARRENSPAASASKSSFGSDRGNAPGMEAQRAETPQAARFTTARRAGTSARAPGQLRGFPERLKLGR